MDTGTNEIYGLLIDYLHGRCSEQERARVILWMEESDDNHKFYLKLKALWYAKNANKNVQEEELLLALQNFRSRALPKKNYFYKAPWLKYAAVFIVFAAISFFVYAQFFRSPNMLVCSVANNSDIKFLLLPDSTRVWLNKQSQLTWPEKFGKHRVVYLKGEGYFEVKKDNKKIFEIKTGNNVSVRVLGTSFNLRVNNAQKTVETTLVHGKVELLSHTGQSMGQLLPGEQFLYNATSGNLTRQKADVHAYTAWHLGTTLLANAGINDIASAIESLYNVKVIVKAPGLQRKKFKFTIHRGQSVETVLEMLKYLSEINYNIEGKTITINEK